jgi:hypothetical protein
MEAMILKPGVTNAILGQLLKQVQSCRRWLKNMDKQDKSAWVENLENGVES